MNQLEISMIIFETLKEIAENNGYDFKKILETNLTKSSLMKIEIGEHVFEISVTKEPK